MPVKVKFPSILRKYTDGQEFAEMPVSSPIECLRSLETRFPKIKRWLHDKDGSLRPQVWFFVNGRRIYGDELNSLMKDGDELSVLFAVGGG